MSPEEKRAIWDSLYPVGKERWMKIMIIDQDKTMKALPWNNESSAQEQGYALTAISVRDEYEPQVYELQQLRSEILLQYENQIPEHILNDIMNRFSNSINTLRLQIKSS